MGFSGFLVNMFYDKDTKTTYCWQTRIGSSKLQIAKNLMHGNTSEVTTKN